MGVGNSQTASLSGRRILLVEDEVLIALSAEEMLRNAGAIDVVLATRPIDAAKHLAGPESFDGAVIDLNLGHGFDFSLAATARERGLPVVLATGYPRSTKLPSALADAPIVAKPYTAESLVAAVHASINNRDH
jgi:DNA-binding NtrC family response regulator